MLHTPTNILLLSLAVSDLLVGLLLMPFEIIRNTACWFFGDLMCSLYNSVSLIITFSSVGDMVLISIDRYVAICDPLHYPAKVTERRVKVSVCLCWLCSIFYGSFIVKDDFTKPGSHNLCLGECVITADHIATAVDIMVSFIVPVIIIIVLYMRVFIVAVSQARAMQSHIKVFTLHLSVTQTKKSELKAARTIGVLVVMFLICFFPYHFMSFVGNNMLSGSFFSYALFLLYLNSTLNPLIYVMFYPWFRKALKLIGTLQILKPGSCEINMWYK